MPEAGARFDAAAAPQDSKGAEPSEQVSLLERERFGLKFHEKKAILQVTVRFPLGQVYLTRPLALLALIYGYTPWLVPFAFGMHWIITLLLDHGRFGGGGNGRFISLYGCLVCVIVSLVNEVILKPLIKDPRPPETANYRVVKGEPGQPDVRTVKEGMPSGHVLNATTVMMWALLEVSIRGPGYDADLGLTVGWVCFILCLMGPVPWARWYNLDHTFAQCWVSFLLGLVVGTAAFWVRMTFFQSHWKYWTPNASGPAVFLASDHHGFSRHTLLSPNA